MSKWVNPVINIELMLKYNAYKGGNNEHWNSKQQQKFSSGQGNWETHMDNVWSL